jgi:ferredoxin like protein
MAETRIAPKKDLPEVYIDDILMSLKYFVDEHQAHLKIKDPQVCIRCEGKPCLEFCPVSVYRPLDGGTVQVAYQACVECGTCRVMCPPRNIDWKLPRGGFGVAYKFG